MLLRHMLRIASTLALLAAAPVLAATQGTLGLTSTGSVTISITKSVQAQIINGQLFGGPLGSGVTNLMAHMEHSSGVTTRPQATHKKS